MDEGTRLSRWLYRRRVFLPYLRVRNTVARWFR